VPEDREMPTLLDAFEHLRIQARLIQEIVRELDKLQGDSPSIRSLLGKVEVSIVSLNKDIQTLKGVE